MHKKIFGILILIEVTLFFLYTFVESNFKVHVGEINFELSALSISNSLTKKHHIFSFGLLTILLLNYLIKKKTKYLNVFIAVFLFSIFVEITQIFFPEGHCRLSDILPNLTGIVFSLGVFRVIEKFIKYKSVISTLLLNITAVATLVLCTLLISFCFKEIFFNFSRL